ncbi:MAG: hypothetical protein R3F38_18300 [Gammaproteobacteria bacterium]
MMLRVLIGLTLAFCAVLSPWAQSAAKESKSILVMCRTGGNLDVYVSSDKKGASQITVSSRDLIQTQQGKELRPGQCGVFERALPGQQRFVDELGKVAFSMKCATAQGSVYRCGPHGPDPVYERLRHFKDDVIVQFGAEPDKKDAGTWQIKRWDGTKPAR